MPGKRSRAVAAALSHPDLSPPPGLVLAPVFTAASAAPAAPSSPLPDWPAPTGECPPHPQRSPSLLPALRTFHRVLTWQPRLARRWVPDRGRAFRHALSTLSHAGRARGAMNTAAAPRLTLRESPAASSSRVSALVGSTRVDRRLALRPPPARPPNCVCEAAAVCVCCVAYVAYVHRLCGCGGGWVNAPVLVVHSVWSVVARLPM